MSEPRCGQDPMGPRRDSVDTATGMTPTIRYPVQAAHPRRESSHARKTPRLPPGATRPCPDEPIDELRTMQLQALRERVVRSEYEVDSRAVAGAILARLLAERSSPGDRQG